MLVARRAPPRCWTGGATGLAVAACLALAACTGDAVLPDTAVGDARAARRQLEAQLASGPLPVLVRNPPRGMTEARIERLAAAGIRGLDVPTVAAEATGEDAGMPRLVLWFDGPLELEAACLPHRAIRPLRQAPPILAAVYCARTEMIAGVEGVAASGSPDAVQRLVWQSTRRLFPDDYLETYGFGLFGNRVGVGGSFGF